MRYSRCWISFSSIGATPTLSRIISFRTHFLLVCPQNHRNIRISATLSCWTCRLFVGQHSAPYSNSTLSVNMDGYWSVRLCTSRKEIRRCSKQLKHQNTECSCIFSVYELLAGMVMDHGPSGLFTIQFVPYVSLAQNCIRKEPGP